TPRGRAGSDRRHRSFASFRSLPADSLAAIVARALDTVDYSRSRGQMRILFVNHLNTEDVYSQFAGRDAEIEIRSGPIADPADVLSPETCRAADAIVNGSAVHDVGPVDPFTNCRIAVRMGVGYDNLDVAAWGARRVPVCNVPDYGTSEVA